MGNSNIQNNNIFIYTKIFNINIIFWQIKIWFILAVFTCTSILLDNLKEKLFAQGVKLIPKNAKELWEEVSNDESILDGVIEFYLY